MGSQNIDPAQYRYQQERIIHWDQVAPKKANPKRPGFYYQQLVEHYYKFFIPSGKRILEFGCGHGDLLSSLQPSVGVGVDFSHKMIQSAKKKHPRLTFIQADVHEIEFKEKFDIIILSDLVNDLWDVQRVFEKLRNISHSGTRLVLNFYNNLWRLPLAIVKKLGLGAEVLEQNWFAPDDIYNLLKLSGFEVVQSRSLVLLPLKVPFLSRLFNCHLVHLPPFRWFALTNIVIARSDPARDKDHLRKTPAVSIIIPARNEAGNIETIIKRVPELGSRTELIFVEGHSTDNTYETIQHVIERYPGTKCKLFQQKGKGKGDAVRLGFGEAKGDILMILDADMTVPPEELARFYNAIVGERGEFINGVRLVYPLEDQSMRFFNILGNKFFSLAFSWLLGQPVKDTLCGTKVLWKRDYEMITKNRAYFGDFDPFGDFDLLFGATKLNLKIAEMPVRYRMRTYGNTNIDRWRHGWLLLKMVIFAAKRIKFI
ncbi:Glycosyltransferase [Olavius sp. associated proteobacterium Delta 1]|nr:Glycosyltransferase [Olavius sp. associated proteobacterium Delta 1]